MKPRLAIRGLLLGSCLLSCMQPHTTGPVAHAQDRAVRLPAHDPVMQAVSSWEIETNVQVDQKVIEAISSALGEIEAHLAQGFLKLDRPIPDYATIISPFPNYGHTGQVRVPRDSMILHITTKDLVNVYLWELRRHRHKASAKEGKLSVASVDPYTFMAAVALRSGPEGFLEVVSTPESVRFKVDGRRMGRTNARLVCSPKVLEVEVGRRGGQPYCKEKVYCAQDEDTIFVCE